MALGLVEKSKLSMVCWKVLSEWMWVQTSVSESAHPERELRTKTKGVSDCRPR